MVMIVSMLEEMLQNLGHVFLTMAWVRHILFAQIWSIICKGDDRDSRWGAPLYRERESSTGSSLERYLAQVRSRAVR